MSETDAAASVAHDRWTGIELGSGLGLVGSGLIAVFDPLNAGLAARLWALVVDGASADDVLEEVSVGGLRSLGSFALAHRSPVTGALHVVVRQAGVVQVGLADTNEVVIAGAARTWVERTFDEPSVVRVMLAGASADFHSPFRVASGVVPAFALQWGSLPALDLSSSESPIVEAADVLRRPVVDAGASAPADHASISAEPTAELAPAVPAGPPQPDSAIAPSSSAAGSSAQTEADAAAAPTETPYEGPHDLSATLIERPEREPGPTPEVLPPPSPTDRRSSTAWDDIYGATVARSVQSAAVFTHNPDDALIDGVPSGEVASQAAPFPDAPQLGDHDGRTITKAQLEAMRSQPTVAPAAIGPMGGVTVQAVLCPAGHASPPASAWCRVCGVAVSAQVVSVPRPSLGVLRMSTGATIALDRPLLIGRKPKVTGMVAGELPGVFQVEEATGLSRTHLAVRLEEWQVLVEDLNSANGTMVTLPGRQPHRLHPGEPALLEHGAVIDLGGELTAEYLAR
jgi:hypothetical protein